MTNIKYRLFKYATAVITLLLATTTGIAQPSFCPPNIDFETGNLNNWDFYVGSCCPLNAATFSGIVTNRHTQTTGTGLDPYGNFPIVAPSGGCCSK